jgi:hypothetical protein
MDTSSIRNTLAAGSLDDVLASLAPDERRDLVLVNPNAGEGNDPYVLARVGRAIVIQMGPGRLMVHVHAHGPEKDAECWAGIVSEAENAVTEHNAVALAVREHPGVQEMIARGFPPSMAAIFNGLSLPADLG